jgi:CYTH domain-containing protein
MALEIERKFLVKGKGWKTDNGELYIQGYLNLDPKRTVRVRIAGGQAFLCVKGPTRKATRTEYEYKIPLDDAKALLEMREGSLIQKIRHTVDYNGMKWEVDEFTGENTGLVIAEIELQSEDQGFDKPPWLGAEVTGEPSYFNSNLAIRPFSAWGKIET